MGVNVLPNSPKISDLTKGDFFQLNFPGLMENWNKSAPVQLSAMFGTREHVDSLRVF